jgi:hypothetical protein
MSGTERPFAFILGRTAIDKDSELSLEFERGCSFSPEEDRMRTSRNLTAGPGFWLGIVLLALPLLAGPQQVPVNPRLNPNPFDRNPHPEACRIQDIRAMSDRPDSMTFEVQYFISPNSLGACFISARVPDIHGASAAFTDVPAGAAPFGVPKGDIRFDDHVEFGISYMGEQALTTTTIEVFISDENGSPVCSKKIQWRKTWSPPGGEGGPAGARNASEAAAAASKVWAEVRGIKAVFESPGLVRFQVRYWLDPSYRQACFISAAVPDFSAPLAAFSVTPAGQPKGIPRGHQTYEDNVAFELTYTGTAPLSTSTIEVRITDRDGKVLASSVQNWKHDWARGQGPKAGV